MHFTFQHVRDARKVTYRTALGVIRPMRQDEGWSIQVRAFRENLRRLFAAGQHKEEVSWNQNFLTTDDFDIPVKYTIYMLIKKYLSFL